MVISDHDLLLIAVKQDQHVDSPRGQEGPPRFPTLWSCGKTRNVYDWASHNYSAGSHSRRTERLPCSRHEGPHSAVGFPSLAVVPLHSRALGLNKRNELLQTQKRNSRT